MVRLATNVTDPIGDMLTRIRNANIATKDELCVPASQDERGLRRPARPGGLHRVVRPRGRGLESVIRIVLKYGKGRERTITGLKRVSKPGRRVYAKRDELPRVMGGLGIAIVSTPRA